MEVSHRQKKGTHLNTIEIFYIHKEQAAGKHLNDEQSIFPNKIFDTLIKPIQPLPPAHPKTDRIFNPYPTAFPYGNGMVLHFYQQQESSTTKTVHKVINKGLKTYV